MKITGAELFVKALQHEQVDLLFAYPGGQAIDLFNSLYGARKINVILPRHEQGLIHAADGYARSTGKVGVCLVTSGPGASNLVTGIATANYDSVPLVCFTGQVPTTLIGNHAFQEVDIVSMAKSICKWAATVRRREDLAGIIQKAFLTAQTGRPGVVVVDLPKDIQQALGSDAYPIQIMPKDIQRISGSDQYPVQTKIKNDMVNADIQIAQFRKALELLRAAKKPLFLFGGGVNIARANVKAALLAQKMGVPVVTTIMGRGAVPTDHPLYIGNLGIHGTYAANKAVSNCDILFAVGVRFSDRITGKASEFARYAAIVHIDIDPAFVSKEIHVDLSIAADAGQAAEDLLAQAECMQMGCLKIREWLEQIDKWKQMHPLGMRQEEADVTPQKIIETINVVFERAVVTADVGQNQMWTTQFLEITEHKRLLTSGGFGTMGYGFPAAVGAKLGCPDKDVISICGDGGIQMNIQELATAAAYELPVIICIMNNGYLGNVRQWQELFYERRYADTCLRRRKSCPTDCSMPHFGCPKYIPDFIRLAESYGAAAIRVERADEILPAFIAAKKVRKRPIVIEFIIGSEENVFPIVAPGKPLSDMILK